MKGSEVVDASAIDLMLTRDEVNKERGEEGEEEGEGLGRRTSGRELRIEGEGDLLRKTGFVDMHFEMTCMIDGGRSKDKFPSSELC